MEWLTLPITSMTTTIETMAMGRQMTVSYTHLPRGGVPLRLPGGVPVPRPAHRQPGGPPRDHAPRGGDSLPGSLRRTQRQTLRPGRHPQANAEADFHAYP